MAIWNRAKHLVFLAILSFGVSALANAQAIQPDAAKIFIENLGNRTVDAMQSQGSTAERNARFTRIMLDSLDFDAIGMTAIGRLARAATPQQKREFTPLFAAYVIDWALGKFGSLELKGFRLGPTAPEPNGDARVNTRVHVGEGPVDVYWRVHTTGRGPKINDIEVTGTSLALSYRSEFDRAGVSTAPQLIARLKELTKSSKSLATVQQAMR